MNEIDFRIKCEKNRLMIILITKQFSSRMTNSNNRKYIIFVEIINVVDDIITSFFIFKKVFIAHRLIVNDLNWTITLVISETTYLNNNLIINWLHHFIRNVKRKQIDQWIFLICDEFDFHVIFFFLKLISVNKIVLFRFLIHSTHLTQSLNVKVFQTYKQHHDNTVNKVVKQKNVKFNCLNFLTIFQSFRNAIFKFKIMKNVWKLIEIISFNFSMIIDSLKKCCDREALLSNILSSKFKDDCFQRKSRDFNSHKQYIKTLRDRFKNDLNIDVFVLRFLKISKKQTIVLKFYTRNLNNC